jgi:hypothetical protein
MRHESIGNRNQLIDAHANKEDAMRGHVDARVPVGDRGHT